MLTFVIFEQVIVSKRRFQYEDEVIVSKRRFQYEDEVKERPYNYDAWFDYIRLEESAGDAAKVREVYERAIAHKPDPSSLIPHP
ncbi:hypothetical protein T484DRAFT_1854079 [Baffinella frigidus]|nr:hypothetical protein T484DRAFT_1854079 [Cryptophyta sp. CCMP2293]